MKQVSYIPPEVFDVVMADAERFLRPAIDQSGDRWGWGDVMSQLMSQQSQLWMVFDEGNTPIAAMTTKIEDYPRKRMLNCIFIGGADLEGWHEELLGALEKFAKDNNCEGLELTGRYGWKRFLASHDWETKYIVCERTFAKEEALEDVA